MPFQRLKGWNKKHKANILVEGKAWGTLEKNMGGSYATAKEATEKDQVLKDHVSRNCYHFSCIAFDSLATSTMMRAASQ